MAPLRVNEGYFECLLPCLILTVVSVGLSFLRSLSTIEFVGTFFSFVLTILFVHKVFNFIYDSWIGVFLGRNINLLKMGKWAVVTGATDGIGLAYCHELAKRGINIVLISRCLNRLKNTANEIEANYGVETKTIQFDFGSSIHQYEATVHKQLEDMDIGTLINNVGLTYVAPDLFHRVTESIDFVRSILNINMTSVTMMTRCVLPGMLNRNRGVIINIGSLCSIDGIPYFSLYAATKSFVQTLTLDLAREYRDTGVHFQYQCPSYVDTKQGRVNRANFFIPTPIQYARKALNTVGLQQCTPVWTSHRIMVPIFRLTRILVPYHLDEIVVKTTRGFWLFAIKSRMKKQKIYRNK